MISVENLEVTYNAQNAVVPVLDNVSFQLEKGSTCAVIGPSGCGKTTLLYVLAGLRAGFKGEVLINGSPVRPRRRETAFILQDYGLLPWKNVWENAVLGLKIRKCSRQEMHNRVAAILKELDLWEFGKHYPSQLSGGQKQRVAIARALAMQPDLLLMDEPFSSLDALTRESLQDNLLHIWEQKRMTMVIVTHSIEEAVFLGQKIIVMSPRPSRCMARVDNREMGIPGIRKRNEYHRLCVQLRELLGTVSDNL